MSNYFKAINTDDSPEQQFDKDNCELFGAVSDETELVIFEFEITQEHFAFDAEILRQFLINLNFVEAVLPITSEDTHNFMQTTIVTISVKFSTNTAISPLIRILKTINVCCNVFSNPENTSKQEISLKIEIKETGRQYNFLKDDINYLTYKGEINCIHLRQIIGRFKHMYKDITSTQIEKYLINNYKLDFTESLLHYDFEKYKGPVALPEITVTHPERLETFYLQMDEQQPVSLLPIALSGRLSFPEQKRAEMNFKFSQSNTSSWLFKLQTTYKHLKENAHEYTLFLAGYLGFFYGFEKEKGVIRSERNEIHLSPLCGGMFVMFSLDTLRPVSEQLAGTEFETHSQILQNILNDITSNPENWTPFRKLVYHH